MGNLSKTRFSIYATSSKYRRRIVGALRQGGIGGGNYYTILESRIFRCENGVGGLTVFDLPDQMNTARYRNPRLLRQKEDLSNAANKYLSVRGKFEVLGARPIRKRYKKYENFKLAVGPDIVWHTPLGKIHVGFYQDKMDDNRLTRRKADFISALLSVGADNPSLGNLIIDLQTGAYFECENDGSVLMPRVQKFCEEIDASL